MILTAPTPARLSIRSSRSRLRPPAERGCIGAVPQAKTWVFQARPGDWDLDGHLAAVPRIEWLVNRHAKQMNIGDTVFLWESGKPGRLLCRCVIKAKPHARPLREDNRRFCLSDAYLGDDVVRASLRVEHVLVPPAERDDVVAEPALTTTAPFGGPTQARMGTNFELSQREARALRSVAQERGDRSRSSGLPPS